MATCVNKGMLVHFNTECAMNNAICCVMYVEVQCMKSCVGSPREVH